MQSKNLLYLSIVCTVLCFIAACTKTPNPSLPVTEANMAGTWTLAHTTSFSYTIPGGTRSETGYTNFSSDTNTMTLSADGQCTIRGIGLGQGFATYALTGQALTFYPAGSGAVNAYIVDNISAHTMQVEHSDSSLTAPAVWLGYTTVWTYSR